MRARQQPDKTIIRYRGIPYELDLAMCRKALVRLEVEDVLCGIDGLARAAHVSRSTVSRFFSGHSSSLRVTRALLDELRLEFDDVVKLCEPDWAGEASVID